MTRITDTRSSRCAQTTTVLRIVFLALRAKKDFADFIKVLGLSYYSISYNCLYFALRRASIWRFRKTSEETVLLISSEATVPAMARAAGSDGMELPGNELER